MKETPMPSVQLAAGMSALRDIQWMARRMAHTATGAGRLGVDSALPANDPASCVYRFNTATYLLQACLARYGFRPCVPDKTASPPYAGVSACGPVGSIWADGTDPGGFTPDESVLAVIGDGEVVRLQYAVDVLHPLATVYADGRATYATEMCNGATRALRAATFSLSASAALAGSIWVADGFGDAYDGLSSVERMERDGAGW